MKNFYDVYDSKLSEAELPTLYCDMDQVLCNFLDGAEKVLGKSFIEFDKDRRWPLIHDKKDFWETLEWMPGAKRLWTCLLYTSPSPRDTEVSRMPSSA